MSMRTPEDVFTDYAGRRQGILTALTSEVDRFYSQCDPDRENLCLYGNPDSSWEVDLPAEEVPPEMPEPALGINFARDGMQVGVPPSPVSFILRKGLVQLAGAERQPCVLQKKDWLSLVAVHSDTWLLAVAFYNGARLNREGRERLFELINEQPTCYEIVSGKASRDAARPKKRGAPGQPARPPSMAAPAKLPRMVSLHITYFCLASGRAPEAPPAIQCDNLTVGLHMCLDMPARGWHLRRPILPAGFVDFASRLLIYGPTYAGWTWPWSTEAPRR